MAQHKSNSWPLRGPTLKLNTVHREIAGLLLIAVALITLLGLFSASREVVIDLWVRVLRLLFGWAAYLAALGFGLGQGRIAAQNFLREGPELVEEVEARVREMAGLSSSHPCVEAEAAQDPVAQ